MTEDQQTSSGIVERIQAVIEDLRSAAESATGAARSKIESAIDQLQNAANAAASRAQGGVSDAASKAHDTADGVRGWVRHAGVSALDEAQKEIDKRRAQLGLGAREAGDETVVTAEPIDADVVDAEIVGTAEPAEGLEAELPSEDDDSPPGGVPV